MQKTEILILE